MCLKTPTLNREFGPKSELEKQMNENIEKTYKTNAICATRLIEDALFVLHAIDVSQLEEANDALVIVHVGILTEQGVQPFNIFMYQVTLDNVLEKSVNDIREQLKKIDEMTNTMLRDVEEFPS